MIELHHLFILLGVVVLNGAEIQRDKEVLPLFTLPSLPVIWVREDGLGSLLKNSVFPQN